MANSPVSDNPSVSDEVSLTKGDPNGLTEKEKGKVPLAGSSLETAPAPGESTFRIAESADDPLFSGEARLVIKRPVNLKTLLELYNYLQALPDVKLVYTSGSKDAEVSLTISVTKPTRIVSLLSNIKGIALAGGTAAGKLSGERITPLIEKKRGEIKEIRLVCLD